ncbi:MAG: penicillin-binding protein 1C [Bacteroidales bacterium]|nr:penicillin-binding protein 1C [Bacteroidales bacterium]
MRNLLRTKLLVFSVILATLLLLFWYSLPRPLFQAPYSTVVYDREGGLLGARIATDGQWRFPEMDSVPDKFRECILNFEDRYFYTHPGVNPFSLGRALIHNIRAGEIVSGGSTLTMQTIRLSRHSKPRTVYQKLIEILLAFRLELQYTKGKILALYSSHAPFGGNVVGLETASWRYFNRDPWHLSWAESALLAVLPNAPSLMHPGRNQDLLKAKRNRLLKTLESRGILDNTSYLLALEEDLPAAPLALPARAFHLTEKFSSRSRGERVQSTIHRDYQQKVEEILERRRDMLYAMGIRNAACLVAEVETGEILAYAGNIRNPEHPAYGGDVDIIPSPRSSGSILKPLLYAMMQYRGEILPNTLIPDIPTRYGNYSPKNYHQDYDGIVDASEALVRSLNVPAVRMLHQYGIERFLQDLKHLGFTSMNRPAEHYGLSLILGGAECSLYDLTAVYASMARVLNHYTRYDSRYFRSDWTMGLSDVTKKEGALKSRVEPLREGEEQGFLGAGAIWLSFEALKELNRPESQAGWEFFNSSRRVAWKTGTSFGFRDGWAIGTTPEFVVAVWTGNADGEGKPGISGIGTAAPLMFDVLNILPPTSWFNIPYDDLERERVCSRSGYKAGRFCTSTDSILVSPAGKNTGTCPFHQLVHLDKNQEFRVSSSCYSVPEMVTVPWFILPPAQEWYYKKKDPSWQPLPPMAENCKPEDRLPAMQFIYPDPGSVIYIPFELSGEKGRVVFEAAHRNPEKKIFWSIDDSFVQETRNIHQIIVLPERGLHTLTLVDEDGNRLATRFEVIERNR